jgi:nucleoside-diphosphate-sugar epimerase
MTSILLAGAGGFAGKYLTENLETDRRIISLTRVATKNSNKNIKIINQELAEPWFFSDSPEIILYLATQHEHSRLLPTPANYINSNITALYQGLEFATKVKSRLFVYFSTITTFGAVTSSVVNEKTPIFDPTFYGASKYFGERLVREYSEKIPVLILRLPGIVGPNMPHGRPWVKTIIEKMLVDEPVEYYNGTAVFNNICDMKTITRFIETIITIAKIKKFDDVNLAATDPMRMSDVISLIKNNLNSRSVIKEKKSDKISFSIDVERVIKNYKFRPDTTINMLTRLVDQC